MEGQRGRLTRLAVALVAVSLVGVVTACGPSDATPTRTATSASETASDTATPTPTPLTEEEAYAAAEATYRAYIDALNDLDFADPATFEPLLALSGGDVNDADVRMTTEYNAAGYTKTGEARVTLVAPHAWDSSSSTATIDACLDVASVDIVDSEGVSIVDVDRVSVQRIRVAAFAGPDGSIVTGITGRTDGPEC